MQKQIKHLISAHTTTEMGSEKQNEQTTMSTGITEHN